MKRDPFPSTLRPLVFLPRLHRSKLIAPSPSPGLLNGLAGILTTIASVYGAQSGRFTATSETTIVVTGVTTLANGILVAFYSLWKLRIVKRRHDKEIGKEKAGLHGEGIVEEMKRKARQPEPEVRMF